MALCFYNVCPQQIYYYAKGPEHRFRRLENLIAHFYIAEIIYCKILVVLNEFVTHLSCSVLGPEGGVGQFCTEPSYKRSLYNQ